MAFKFKNIAFYAWLIFIATYAISCARQSNPNGGPKDETPPTVLEAEPGLNATNFSGDKIVLKFNEYVKLDNIEQELSISPYSKEKPTVFLKGKKLIVKLPKTLQANTTYAYNFGNAIGDLTEGNKAENLTYVFSTGSYIDSLKIDGKVTDATNGKGQADVKVILYNSNSDSLIFKENPAYLTTTNKNGQFEFKHLPNLNFKIAAIEEANNNNIYDFASERIAFYKNAIATTDSNFINLLLYSPKLAKSWTYQALKDSGRFVIISEGFDSINIKPLNDSTNLVHYNYNFLEDSLLAYFTTLKEKAEFLVFEKDSLLDTIRITTKVDVVLKDTFALKPYGLQKQFHFNENNKLILHSKYPIKKIEPELISILADSVATNNISYFVNEAQKNLLQFYGEFDTSKVYTFQLGDGAITNMFNKTSAADTINLKPLTNNDFTSLNISLLNVDSTLTYFAQLYAGESKLLATQTLDSFKTTFSPLPTGNYSIKIIEDVNKNGSWDNGLYQVRQPERIFETSDKPTAIKAGIEHNIELEINSN